MKLKELVEVLTKRNQTTTTQTVTDKLKPGQSKPTERQQKWDHFTDVIDPQTELGTVLIEDSTGKILVQFPQPKSAAPAEQPHTEAK